MRIFGIQFLKTICRIGGICNNADVRCLAVADASGIDRRNAARIDPDIPVGKIRGSDDLAILQFKVEHLPTVFTDQSRADRFGRDIPLADRKISDSVAIAVDRSGKQRNGLKNFPFKIDICGKPVRRSRRQTDGAEIFCRSDNIRIFLRSLPRNAVFGDPLRGLGETPDIFLRQIEGQHFIRPVLKTSGFRAVIQHEILRCDDRIIFARIISAVEIIHDGGKYVQISVKDPTEESDGIPVVKTDFKGSLIAFGIRTCLFIGTFRRRRCRLPPLLGIPQIERGDFCNIDGPADRKIFRP